MSSAHRLRGLEWLLIILILMGGFALRVSRFGDVPPGVIHDEVLNWLNTRLILRGDIRPLYPYGGGREALYLFVQAVSFRLIGDNMLAARFPSMAASLIGMALSFGLARRLFGRGAGLVTAAGWAVSFWSLMFARLALRPGLLPVMALVVAYLVLRLLQDRRPAMWRYGLVGAALGATLYTYSAALIFPLILIAWIGMVALTRREWLEGKWLPLALSFVTAGAMAIPLASAWSDPALTARADAIDMPLEALLSGDPGPVLANVHTVLSIFSVRGDHGLEFNVENQTLFPTIPMAIFFYVGVAWAIGGLLRPRDERRLGYALALLWLVGMLVPTLATERPANLYRTIGALGTVYMFPAIAFVLAREVAQRAERRHLRAGIALIVALGLVLELDHTVRSYFVTWAENPVVRFLYQDDYRQLANDLDARTDRVSIAIGGLTPDRMDPASMRLLMADDERANSLGFFDPQTSLLLPSPDPAAGLIEVIVPDFVTLHPALAGHLPAWGLHPETFQAYTRYVPNDGSGLQPPVEVGINFYPSGSVPLAHLTGIEPVRDIVPGDEFTLLSYWHADRPSDSPLRIFVHLVASDGTILSQSDVLGVPATQWRAGDVIVQAHDLMLPSGATSGPYLLHIGLYNPETGIRLLVDDPPGGDHVQLPLSIP